MKRILVLLLLICACGAAWAEPARFEIPSTEWGISFDAPPLSQKQDRRNGGNYAFRANSGRFNLSFFVETPQGPGATHDDTFRYYWPQASRNQMIDKASVKIAPGASYVRVQYDILADLGGRKLRMRNVNYYIAYGGKWVDVHISMVEPTAEDEQVFTDFDNSLHLGAKPS